MKFLIPWFIKLPIYLFSLNCIPIYFYCNPYALKGGIEHLRDSRSKKYSQVRYKNEDDVQVQTEESNQFYNRLKAGDHPLPLYSKFPLLEEIKTHGLYVIGEEMIGDEASQAN